MFAWSILTVSQAEEKLAMRDTLSFLLFSSHIVPPVDKIDKHYVSEGSRYNKHALMYVCAVESCNMCVCVI